MHVTNNNTDKQTTKKRRCDLIMSRIESEAITPCPRWQFLCFQYGVWVLWALTVVAGAIAVAVMIYVGNHMRFELYEATHDTPLSFFVEVLPYIWIFIFVLMVGFAFVNMRHTKRGYRYPIAHIILSSVLLSFVGGAVLHVFGTGHLIDNSLGRGMPTYPSLERTEMRMWQNPREGRLVGVFQEMMNDEMHYLFTDKNDTLWTVTVVELRAPDRELLTSGKLVRVLGTTTDRTRHHFHACGVFPWMFGSKEPMPVTDLAAQRQTFIERMYEHMETGDRLRTLEEATFAIRPELDGRPFMDGICADIAAVKRFKFAN